MKIIYTLVFLLANLFCSAQVNRTEYESFAVSSIILICEMKEYPCDVYIKQGDLYINKIIGLNVSAEDYLLTDIDVHKKRALDYCYALTRQLNSAKIISYLQGIDFHGMIRFKVTYRLTNNSDQDYTLVTFADSLYKITPYLNKDDFANILSGL